MTSEPQSQSPLRVVPPTPDAPKPAPNPAPSPPQPEAAEPAATAKPETQNSGQGWLRVGAVVLVLGAVGFIPTDSYIGADAEAQAQKNQRQAVTMPADGQPEFYHDSQDPVQVGEPVVRIVDLQLGDRIRDLQRTIQQKEGELRRSEIDLERAEQRLQSARDEENQAYNRLANHNQDLQALMVGPGLPASRQLDHERDSIQQDIAGVGDEIRSLDAQIEELKTQQLTLENQASRLRGKIQGLEERQERITSLRSERNPDTEVVALYEPHLDNLRDQIFNYEQELLRVEGENSQINYQIQQLEHEKNRQRNRAQGRGSESLAVAERQEELIRQLQDERQTLQDRYEQKQNHRRTIQAEVTNAQTTVSNTRLDIEALKTELQELEKRQENNIIDATVSGVILTEDLDLQNRQNFQRGQEILSIVNVEQLDGVAYVSQGDRHLIEIGQTLTLRLKGQADFRYNATIESTSPHFTEDELQPVLKVTFTIDNPDKYPLIGAEAYVNIEIEKRNLYQKMHHQFSKLIDVPRYFPWFSGE